MSDTTHQPNTPECHFLSLPSELRLQIYNHIFSAARNLTLRSLFIRANFINVFMTQQPKNLSPALLRVNRQINTEAAPILYSLPQWNCGCRIESLAVQIGMSNFARIRRMSVDVDDLDMLVESLQRTRQRRVHRGSGYAMQMIPVRRPVALRPDGDDTDDEFVVSAKLSSRTSRCLNFSNLETLEVDGYQAAALDSRGGHRVRLEALRLCEFAMQLLDFHPQLRHLLEKKKAGADGGADARDLTLGRVRWKFVKDIDRHTNVVGWVEEHDEHVVDLPFLRSTLEFMIREDDRMMESSMPTMWMSTGTGRYNQYPFLQTA